MNFHFSVKVETEQSIVRIAMSGFFQPSDVSLFVDARNTEHRQLRCPPNGHLTLVDIRGMKIQSQESVRAFAEILSDPIYASRKIAFVVETSLARMQLKRAAAGRDGGFFDSPKEAEIWLLQP
jgi:hypothetical protein